MMVSPGVKFGEVASADDIMSWKLASQPSCLDVSTAWLE